METHDAGTSAAPAIALISKSLSVFPKSATDIGIDKVIPTLRPESGGVSEERKEITMN